MSTFREFTTNIELDVRAWKAAVPSDAKARGMFFHTLQKVLKTHDKEELDGSWIAFKQYSRLEYFEAMLECAERVKERTVEDGLFKAGRFVYPDFAQSLIGRSIFAVAGTEILQLARLAPRAYAVANARGSCEVVRADESLIHVRLDDVWDLTPYSAGIFQGVIDLCGKRTLKIEYREQAPGYVEFKLHYR